MLTYAIIATPLLIYARPLFDHFSQMLVTLPGAQMIALEVASPFVVPIKLALYFALYLSAPIFFYQLWQFIAPALYPSEKKPTLLLSGMSVTLFYLGAAFAYGVVCQLAIKFFVNFAPSNVQVMTDMSLYLGFVLKMMVVFGLSFQVPIVVSILMLTGVQTAESLKRKRPYLIIAAFVIGMLLTPPDVVSQILMALPMIGLFELGLLLGAALTPTRDTVP